MVDRAHSPSIRTNEAGYSNRHNIWRLINKRIGTRYNQQVYTVPFILPPVVEIIDIGSDCFGSNDVDHDFQVNVTVTRTLTHPFNLPLIDTT